MCKDCDDKILNPSVEPIPFCKECPENNDCFPKLDANCVIYNIDNTKVSKLNNLGIGSGASASYIFEEIDRFISNGSNIDLKIQTSPSVLLTAIGAAGHTLKAEVKISADAANQLSLKNDGLFVGIDSIGLGKVKVNSADTLDYLQNQIIGATDGIISIDTPVVSNTIEVTPSLNIQNLLLEIKTNHLNLFNQLFSNTTSTITQQSAKLVAHVAYPYFGPMDVFNASGVGIDNKGFSKVYVCNGTNGTPDLRGRGIVGANINTPGGGALDASVDSSLVANTGYDISTGSKKGTYSHTLTTAEIPSHNHTITDPGHSHTFPGQKFTSHPSGGTSNEYRDADTQQTATAYTGITLANTGGGSSHNNTHPIMGAIYIMYIP